MWALYDEKCTPDLSQLLRLIFLFHFLLLFWLGEIRDGIIFGTNHMGFFNELTILLKEVLKTLYTQIL